MWCATPCKTAFRNPVRLAVVIWVLLGLLWPSSSVSAWVNAAPDDSPKPFPIGPIPLPPVSGSSRWYIPKGYNSGGTHANGNVYSLDFVLAKSDTRRTILAQLVSLSYRQ